MTTRFQHRRLLKLAEHLETGVPRKRFNMNFWKREAGCGTVCCAMGHGVSVPSLRRAGLKFLFTELWQDNDDDEERDYTVVCNGQEGLSAAEEVFGISFDQAEYLFMPMSYSAELDSFQPITPKIVARRIRKFVEEKLSGQR